MKSIINIVTRKSNLALWQTESVAKQLKQLYPELNINIIPVVTAGDKILDSPLAKIGGKGLFVKELEQQLIDNQADLAVHSLKDMPAKLPPGLTIGAILKRDDPRDALISNSFKHINDLPANAKVGTASLRRQSQLLSLRSDLNITTLRGNIITRLEKLNKENFAAIILAKAGLDRLQLAQDITTALSPEIMLPAVAQGALGIECRADDLTILNLIAPLVDENTNKCILAERAMNKVLGGGCQAPIGGFATINNQQITLKGFVGSLDGKTMYQAQFTDNMSNAQDIGIYVAEKLKQQGAAKLISSLL